MVVDSPIGKVPTGGFPICRRSTMTSSRTCAAACANHPTIFHVTHWKAGSQWVRSVLKYAAPKRFVQPRPNASDPLGGPVVPGAVYAPVYAPYGVFRAAVPE